MARPFDRPVKRAPRSDPQRTRLYRFESEQIGARGYCHVEPKRAAGLIRSLARAYGIPAPKVVFSRKIGKWAAEWCRYADGTRVITLNPVKRGACELITICHEVAHHVHDVITPVDINHPAHGKHFMCCYGHILDTVRFMPRCAWRAACAEAGLEVLDPDVLDGPVSKVKALFSSPSKD